MDNLRYINAAIKEKYDFELRVSIFYI